MRIGLFCLAPLLLSTGACSLLFDSSVAETQDAGAEIDAPVVDAAVFSYAPSNVDLEQLEIGTASLALATGTIVFDTDRGCVYTVVVDGPTTYLLCEDGTADIGFQVRPTGAASVAVFSFSSLDLGEEATLNVTGERAIVLVVGGEVRIAGAVSVSANHFKPGAGGFGSQLGSGAGFTDISGNAGGGGGGFGGVGGASGNNNAGGAVYGQTSLVPLQGGSGGGNSQASLGGAGGGALQISAAASLIVTGSGHIAATGGGGSGGVSAAIIGAGGGGGSGGAILLESPDMSINGFVSANGGGGGAGADGASNGGDGGDGGFDRIGAGGLGPTGGGFGGPGSDKEGVAGVGGAGNDSDGGGGGGAGRIRFNTPSTITDIGVSPNLASGLATIGELQAL